MSTERDIIIERLEQKLAARDKEIAQMQESLRESISSEIEKKLDEKSIEMHTPLKNSLLEQNIRDYDNRMDRIERRLIELNSQYDGVMKELLDQKSIIQELKARKTASPRQETKPEEEKPPPEKPKPKGEYIIAENFMPRKAGKTQLIIEADEAVASPVEKERSQKPSVKKSEKVIEGVEITETLKRGK